MHVKWVCLLMLKTWFPQCAIIMNNFKCISAVSTKQTKQLQLKQLKLLNTGVIPATVSDLSGFCAWYGQYVFLGVTWRGSAHLTNPTSYLSLTYSFCGTSCTSGESMISWGKFPHPLFNFVGLCQVHSLSSHKSALKRASTFEFEVNIEFLLLYSPVNNLMNTEWPKVPKSFSCTSCALARGKCWWVMYIKEFGYCWGQHNSQ